MLAVIAVLGAAPLTAMILVVAFRAEATDDGWRFPLPAQAAAIAELLDVATPEEAPRILQAVNSPDVRVVVLPITARATQAADRAFRFSAVEWLVEAYADALAPREVAVYFASGEPGRLREAALELGPFSLTTDRPVRLDIMLSDDRLLRLETRGGIALRLFAWPLGIAAGVFGVVLSLLTVRAMWREVRPLRTLAGKVDRFARAAQPQPMSEDGPEETRAVIGAFNRMQARVAELLRARSVMLGALGHDLRTYLTRLRLRADLVEDPEQQARMIRDLDGMASVIAACTTLARLEGGALEQEETALAPIFARLAETHPALFMPPGAAATDAVVWGDRDALFLALDNLATNAFRYGRASPEAKAEVALGLRVDDDPLGARDPVAVITIEDRGPGVAPGSEAALFDAFIRGDAARNLNAPGSGLGLAIVAAVARAHRGTATLKNRAGGGLCAELTLPMAF